MWLKRWAEGRKGEDGMTVYQELDLAGKSENGRNLGKTIPQTHLPLKKSACAGLWILRVGSERCPGSTPLRSGPSAYKHLSDPPTGPRAGFGRWESV